MRAGVLAAGLGERLRADGVEEPKSLVRVAGRPLLVHALAAVRDAGADDAVVVVNDADAAAVEAALGLEDPPLPVRLVRRTTASSLETFCVVAPHLVGAPRALVAMVDGVFPPGAAAGFGAALGELREGEGLIGVSDRRDDDRPLRVAFDADTGRVRAIGPGAEASPWATAGLYCLPERAFAFAERALAEGLGALRHHLSGLVAAGVPLRAHALGEVVDVDRADDLGEAERLLGAAS